MQCWELQVVSQKNHMLSAVILLELLKPLVQPICDFLKEHRITSRGLLIPHLLDDITKEDCAALFKVLKLKQLYFPIDDTDRFEAIFELKNLVGFSSFFKKKKN